MSDSHTHTHPGPGASGTSTRPPDHPPATDAAQQRLRLEVTGMTCAACSARVQRVLERTHGVSGANVNLMTKTAAVDFDPDVTSPEGLVAAVESAGYGAIVDPESVPATHHHAHHDHAAAPRTCRRVSAGFRPRAPALGGRRAVDPPGLLRRGDGHLHAARWSAGRIGPPAHGPAHARHAAVHEAAAAVDSRRRRRPRFRLALDAARRSRSRWCSCTAAISTCAPGLPRSMAPPT